jgi:hypothetical protein
MKPVTNTKMLFVIIFALGLPLAASADCFIEGHCEAEPNTEAPDLGAWKYTVELSWSSCDNHGLSHIDLLLGFKGHSCECEEFVFNFNDPAGNSDGVRDDDCVLFYEGEFECYGDPSLPDIHEPILKFEPIEEDCEAGPEGSGTFVFYSNWEPGPVQTPNEWLVFKAAGNGCSGPLSGVLPGLACETTASSEASWGDLKSLF